MPAVNKPSPSLLDRVLDYHDRTKHHLHGYARSLGYMDWATQPNPFRIFDGASQIPLKHPNVAEYPHYDDLFAEDHGDPKVPAAPLGLDAVSRLFYRSLAISAWKQAPSTDRWSLRVNPSSGDLHPTESYLISGPISKLTEEPSVFHYSPLHHALERRFRLTQPEWQSLALQLPPDALLIAFASIHWRESWKYGERAFRYCHHDVGHAIGALTISAAALGWETRLIDTVPDRAIATLLGLDRQSGPEAEHADCLLVVFPRYGSEPGDRVSFQLPDKLLKRLCEREIEGQPNRLSESHHPWPIIDEVAEATRYAGFEARQICDHNTGSTNPIAVPGRRPVSAPRIIRTRRSAVAMDGHTSIQCETFYHMMARVIPPAFPFRVLPWSPAIALALFVHRVDGLPPGIYTLVRHANHLRSLRASMGSEFEWQKPETCPTQLGLYLLAAGDAREAAQIISCYQEIAADGAFSLGMLADFSPLLAGNAPWFYPRLFWETGLIGQVLYLEAEAAGVRATGIGCFFDDATHDLLGITNKRWQSLYHFTVGGAVDDPRLQTIPAYFHLGVGAE